MRSLTSLSIVFLLILSSCVSKSRETELMDQIANLEQQLDDCANGADKILGKLQVAFDKGDRSSVKTYFWQMENKHPETTEYQKAKEMADKVVQMEEEEAAERKRLAEAREKAIADSIARAKRVQEAALRKLSKKYDDITGTTRYRNPYFTHYNNINSVSLTFWRDKEDQGTLQLKMSYEGSDWIFFTSAALSYDGNTEYIYFDEYYDKKSDNGAYSVWEWIVVDVKKADIEFLEKLANSKNAKMRLSGKYTKTRNLTWNERQGIKDVINGWKATPAGKRQMNSYY